MLASTGRRMNLSANCISYFLIGRETGRIAA
jgi:hypothetical protein